ncbi:hypothetical protein [Mesorhizobium sp. M1365]|uniref:hypothetical protein n=1 Tax=Mesorhizobium sp. M1365 TaxID=2957090 RepID=UPI00333A8C4D
MKAFARVLSAVVVSMLLGAGASLADPGNIPVDPALAINHPDEFNWRLFADVNKDAHLASRPGVAIWETWADDPGTFPAPASLPAGSAPMWPDPEKACARLRSNVQLNALRSRAFKPFVVPFPDNNPHQQETRRNKATFDFIVGQNLWSRAGLADRFKSGQPIIAPSESIEVKADWLTASADDSKRYHVSVDCNGKSWKLVGLHIISKALPNWSWATFEHVDNAGRCDFIGCHDSYGATVSSTSPLQSAEGEPVVGGTYPADATCKKTEPLTGIFTAAGLDQAVWGNYCLKGSQVDFTTLAGEPTRLGNSVTEKGFVRTSSCMSCHSRASTDAGGLSVLFPGFVKLVGEAAQENSEGPIGSPDPFWFKATDLQVLSSRQTSSGLSGSPDKWLRQPDRRGRGAGAGLPHRDFIYRGE